MIRSEMADAAQTPPQNRAHHRDWAKTCQGTHMRFKSLIHMDFQRLRNDAAIRAQDYYRWARGAGISTRKRPGFPTFNCRHLDAV